MQLTKFSISIILFIPICMYLTIFIGLTLHTIRNNKISNQNATIENSDLTSRRFIENSTEHLFWFLQISDIHISIFHDLSRINNFKEFCNATIDIIKPALVIASGDLTHSKTSEYAIGSGQVREEWILYNKILTENPVANRTLWLDIRGNHDTFNIANTSANLYNTLSVQGKKYKGSYMYSISTAKDKYSFIGVDATLKPGPKSPWNFIGKISSDEFKQLRKFEKLSRNSNATIWFGHYPTSCIISPRGSEIRELMKSASAYLCGHLHQLRGTKPNIYALQREGFLELELGDWKHNRVYRVAAFDHGLFTFIDVTHGSWPVILITNPNSVFSNPNAEQLQMIRDSTNIRVLVFSPNPLVTVEVKIDDEDFTSCTNIKGPLFVQKWQPDKYFEGIHHISVFARDRKGRTSEITQSFALDGTQIGFPLFSRLFLMTNLAIMTYIILGLLILVTVTPLLGMRILVMLANGKYIIRPNIQKLGFLRKFWITSTINKLFYPLTIYPLYLLMGPWFVGEIVDEHYGVVFAWGVILDGDVFPGSASDFTFGCLQILWFHIPLMIALSACVELRFRTLCLKERCSRIRNNIAVGVILIMQSCFSVVFYLEYESGSFPLFLSPLRTWPVIVGFILWYFTYTLGHRDLIKMERLWRHDARGLVSDSTENIHLQSLQSRS